MAVPNNTENLKTRLPVFTNTVLLSLIFLDARLQVDDESDLRVIV